jgi:putative zinc finger protein
MSACEQIRLLLGPFDDGELEPHEMEDVAFHVVSCNACKAELDDFRAIGVSLRDASVVPSIETFAAAVQARIAETRIPWRTRLARRFDSIAERIGAAAAIGAVGAFAAVVTAIVATPYVNRIMNPPAAHHDVAAPANQIAQAPEAMHSVTTPVSAPDFGSQPEIASFQNFGPLASSSGGSGLGSIDGVPPVATISSLESDSPSLAVWNEPQTKTTVIWVPK